MTVKSQWEQATQEKVVKWKGVLIGSRRLKMFELLIYQIFLLYLILIKQAVPYTHTDTHTQVYYLFSCVCQMLLENILIILIYKILYGNYNYYTHICCCPMNTLFFLISCPTRVIISASNAFFQWYLHWANYNSSCGSHLRHQLV